MRNKELAARELIDLIQSTEYRASRYSGRSMYGAECVSVTCEDEINLILDLITASAGEGESAILDVVDTLHGAKTDSMGRSVVVYWPKLPWPADIEDEDDDEDEGEDA